MLQKITTIFQYQQDNNDRRRIINTMKNRIDRLFTFLIAKIGQNPIVWRALFDFTLELENYVNSTYKHYKNLHETNTINPHDVLDGYETLESTKTNANNDLNTIKQNLVETKQTELNMTMKVGWELRKDSCLEVYKILKEYIEAFHKHTLVVTEKDQN